MSEELFTKLVEKINSKFYGKYKGYVTDNKDPEKRGRIKTIIPSLLGDEETGWCEPCVPYGGKDDTGFFMIPEIDAGAWIEFEAGEISHPIWSGTWWASNKIPKEATDKIEPTKKIIKTSKGLLLMFEDDDGKEKITIQDKTQTNKIEMDSMMKSITIQSSIIEIKGDKVDIKASGILTISGATVKIN